MVKAMCDICKRYTDDWTMVKVPGWIGMLTICKACDDKHEAKKEAA